MTPTQTEQAQRAALNCARAGVPYEIAAIIVADWMKKRGIQITIENLEYAFAKFLD